jgi:hypothetical protein
MCALQIEVRPVGLSLQIRDPVVEESNSLFGGRDHFHLQS